MITIDTTGFLCPKPLILTKQALREMEPGTSFIVLTDNEISRNNLLSFLTDHGAQPHWTLNGKVFSIQAVFNGINPTAAPAEEYCTTDPELQLLDSIVVFRGDKMGEGDPELGSNLVKAFFQTVQDAPALPGTFVFYNAGVLLCKKDSPVIQDLKNLESKGVKIILCGNCVSHYQLTDQIAAGVISNMLDIFSIIMKAPKVLYP